MSDVFKKTGNYWTLAFDGTVVHVRDAKGLCYLARLLACPAQPMAADALAIGTPGTGAAPDEGAPLASAAAGAAGEAGRRSPEAERARSAVTKRIKVAIKRIHGCHPPLGRHLMRTVRTGYTCMYQPDPERPTRWVVS